MFRRNYQEECKKWEIWKKKTDREMQKLKWDLGEVERKKQEELKKTQDYWIQKYNAMLGEVEQKRQREWSKNQNDMTKLNKVIEVGRKKVEDLKKEKFEITKSKKTRDAEAKIQEELKKKQEMIEKLNKTLGEIEYKKREDLKKKQDEVDKLKKVLVGVEHKEQEDLKKKEVEVQKWKKMQVETERKGKEELKKKHDEVGRMDKMLEEVEHKKWESLKMKLDDRENMKRDVEEVENVLRSELMEKQIEIDTLKREKGEIARKNIELLNKKQDEIEKLEESSIQADYKVLKKRHYEKVAELKSKHKELVVLANRERGLLNTKKAELEAKDKENKDLHEELKLYVFKRRGFSVGCTMDFYCNMANNMQTDLPRSKITFLKMKADASIWPPSVDQCKSLIPLSPVELEVGSLPNFWFNCIPSHNPEDFDRDNWRVLVCAIPAVDGIMNVRRWIIAYYDGDTYHSEVKKGVDRIVIPIPCSPQYITNYSPLKVYNIVGVGTRLSFCWANACLSGDNE